MSKRHSDASISNVGGPRRGRSIVMDPGVGSPYERFDAGVLLEMISGRAIGPYALSDGATSSRGASASPGTAGNVAGRAATFRLRNFVVPASGYTTIATVFGLAASGVSPDSQANALTLQLQTNGTLRLNQTGAVTTDFRRLDYANFITAFLGRTIGELLITFPVGDSTTAPTIYADGADISTGFVLSTGNTGGAGTVPNWMPPALDCTKFVCAYFWPGGVTPLAEYGFGSWTNAEALVSAQTGRAPNWWAAATGSAVAIYASDFSVGLDSWDSQGGYTGGTSVNTGNVDANADAVGSPPSDNWQRAARVAAAGTGPIGFYRNATPSKWLAGRKYPVVFDIFIPAGSPITHVSVSGWTGAVTRTYSTHALVAGVVNSITSEVAPIEDVVPWLRVTNGAGATQNVPEGAAIYLKNYASRVLGPAARWQPQAGCAVATDSGANGIPLFLASGMIVIGDLPDHLIVPGPAMTADGFIHANQVLTDARYELVAAYARQTGTATSTITVRETSSGGTVVATGALSASTARVALTVSNGLLAGGKALHLSNSAWGGNTVTPHFVFRRCQMP